MTDKQEKCIKLMITTNKTQKQIAKEIEVSEKTICEWKKQKEFKDEIKNCEFIGCTHIKEENCGIKQGVKEGKISQERYNRFCKIYEELKKKEETKKW